LNKLYQMMVEKGYPTNAFDVAAPFREGKLAMITDGNWALVDYRAALGDRLGVAPLPAGPAGPASPLLGVDGFFFNPNSPNKEAALRVALYLTNASSQVMMMNEAGHVPARSDVQITDPLIQGFVDAFQFAMPRPQVPQMGLYWSNFCNDSDIFVNGVSPDEFVKIATSNANR
jgi:arabinogalactan oligomer/maltooligosaccharide transport system substrate-binding protein